MDIEIILIIVFYIVPAVFLIWQAAKNNCQDATAYTGAIIPIFNLILLYGVIRYMIEHEEG